MLLLLLVGVTACASGGFDADCTGRAIRLSEQAIAALSDVEVQEILSYNEAGAKRGCYVPNR